MRAKNEYKFIAEAYDTKLILERIVDGTLMCPEACCGAPVMECKCGPDCAHCNCHEIQKLAKKDKTIKEFYKMRDPDGDGSWPDDDDDRRDHPDYGEPEYGDTTGEYGEDAEDKEAKALEWELGGGRYTHPAKTYNSGSPRVRLTRDSPGTASVHLPVGHPNIQKYLDHGYKIVKDYKKATQSEDAESDAALWKRQWRDQPDISPEEVERLKNRKPKPQSYSKKHPKSKKVEYHPGYGPEDEELHPATRAAEEIIGSLVTWEPDSEAISRRPDGLMKGEVVDVDVEKGTVRVQTGFGQPAEEYVVEIGELTKVIPRKPRPLGYPTEDNEEPRRGISGYEHKPDALVSARQAGAKHKPYVSSFVSDGGKIFGVMGSDGKIVHKTRDKQKAYKWFRDNYENI